MKFVKKEENIMKDKIIYLALFIICFLPLYSFAQNMLQNGGMESEEGWEIVYYNVDGSPSYEFNYAGELPRFGRGGCLRITLEDNPNGQVLFYQRVVCQAGHTYRATGSIKLVYYESASEPLNQGPWFQYYVSDLEPPPEGDYNPGGGKMFDITGWAEGCIQPFDGRWEELACFNEITTAPYWTCPGDPGTGVEVTIGLKFGHWGPDPASYELLVDDVGFYDVESNLLENGGMESDAGWEIQYYNADESPSYTFNYTDALPPFGRGGCLYVNLDNNPNGQLLLYQRVLCNAGQEYRASGAIQVVDYYSDFDPVSQGPWYQFYVTDIAPDPAASDFNPAGGKMFDISAWDADCSMADFEQFSGLWESVACLSEIPTAPYWVCPGDPGTGLEVTVGIKFGHWAPTAGSFEVLVDDVMFFPWSEGGTGVAKQTDPAAPGDFVLEQNFPNPFNPETTINFSVPENALTSLKVYNILGEAVAILVDGQLQAGPHSATFHISDLPSGVYHYTLKQNNYETTRKCVITK
jgi:hypothetical protein